MSQQAELCPHCKRSDLSGWNATNRERHVTKCKKENPYPRMNPAKHTKQTKINFMPAIPVQTAQPEEDFVIERIVSSDIAVTETAAPEAEDTEMEEKTTSPALTTEMSEPTTATSTAGTSHVSADVADDDLEIIGVDAIPSLVCDGFVPEIPSFYENFPFQLLPSAPHIVVCGSSFHHLSCSSGQFQLLTAHDSTGGVNKQCMLLEKDEKLTSMLTRGCKQLK